MFTIRRILHPTDFSDSSRSAFEVASALARDHDAELLVCYVEPWPAATIVEGVALDLPAGSFDAELARLAALRADDPGVRIVRRALRGEAAAEILKAAAEYPADLIVMGTHGRSGLSRLVVGSVTETVLRQAPCPVLTVRASAHPAHDPKRAVGAAIPGAT